MSSLLHLLFLFQKGVFNTEFIKETDRTKENGNKTELGCQNKLFTKPDIGRTYWKHPAIEPEIAKTLVDL